MAKKKEKKQAKKRSTQYDKKLAIKGSLDDVLKASLASPKKEK